MVSVVLQKVTVRDTKPLIILSSLLLGNLFTNKALVVLCKLDNWDQVKTCSLLDTEATGIAFIDKKIACRICQIL